MHPEEGPIRKLMYELFLELRRKKAVANHLNRAGYRTRNGAKFCGTTVGRLLQDTTAKGLHRTNYSRRADNGNAWEFKPESEWVFTEVEPIISEELWNQCSQILGTTSTVVNRPAKIAVHLFAGLVFCECGNKMYVPANSLKYICKACRSKIPADDLEGIFFEQLNGFLVSPTEVNAYLDRAADTLDDKERLLESRKKEAEKIRQETDRTYRLYLENQITSEAFGKFFKPLEERQKQVDEEIPRLQAGIDFLKINKFSSNQVMNDALDLQARWPQLEPEEKRKIIECITNKIVIAKDAISIDLCYLPSCKEMSKREWSLGGSNP